MVISMCKKVVLKIKGLLQQSPQANASINERISRLERANLVILKRLIQLGEPPLNASKQRRGSLRFSSLHDKATHNNQDKPTYH